MATREVTKTESRLAARCAAIASVGASVIHFAVTPMHGRDWLPSGVFFAVLAGFQLMWAIAVWSRPRTWLLAAGIAANAGAAALWVISCITGPPVGPSAGQPEAVGAAGICVLLLQCYVVMGAAWAWTRTHEPEEVSGFGRAMVLMGANTIMAGAVAVGLAASLQGHHHHHHGGATEAQADHHSGHEAHMEGHHHDEAGHADPVGPPGPAAPRPATAPEPVEAGLPVTDMSLDIADADLQPQQSTPNPAVPQHSSPAAPSGPGSTDSETDSDGDGHHHDHHD
ncbi:MAG: hypothetical protein U0R81_01295 [Mycobacterium sp.]